MDWRFSPKKLVSVLFTCCFFVALTENDCDAYFEFKSISTCFCFIQFLKEFSFHTTVTALVPRGKAV